ncbi:MAG: pyrimidine dimer DNA glycosylase/endonuclease V, partial [Bacteroidales bacterium]
MNIFLLDYDLDKNMEQMVDRHCIKQILESTQLLCSAYYFTNESYLSEYKLSHANHPCAIWVRHSLENWLWLKEYALKLCKEYTYRYGKIHKCQNIVDDMFKPSLPSNGLTKLPCVMPEKYIVDDVVQS